MGSSIGAGAARVTGFVYGIISLAAGVAVFALFVGHPSNLLYLLPRGLARTIVRVAPWLLNTTSGPPSRNLLVPLLGSLLFVGFGLWSLGTALFGPVGSLSGNLR